MDDKTLKNIEDLLRQLPSRLARALADFGKSETGGGGRFKDGKGQTESSAKDAVTRPRPKQPPSLRITDEPPRPERKPPSLLSSLGHLASISGGLAGPVHRLAHISRGLQSLAGSLGLPFPGQIKEEVPVVGPPRDISQRHMKELEFAAEHVASLVKTGKSPGIEVVPPKMRKPYRLAPEGEITPQSERRRRKLSKPLPVLEPGLRATPDIYGLSEPGQRITPERYDLVGESRQQPLDALPLIKAGKERPANVYRVSRPGLSSADEPYPVSKPDILPTLSEEPQASLTRSKLAPGLTVLPPGWQDSDVRRAQEESRRKRQMVPDAPVKPYDVAPPREESDFPLLVSEAGKRGKSRRPPSAVLNAGTPALPPGQGGPGAKSPEDKQLADEMKMLRDALKDLREAVKQTTPDETENLETNPKGKSMWSEGAPEAHASSHVPNLGGGGGGNPRRGGGVLRQAGQALAARALARIAAMLV